MSVVTDLTGLVELESQAPEPVDTPELEPVDTNKPEDSPAVENKTEDAEPENKVEDKTEGKAEDGKVERAAKVEPKTLASSIHENLQKFFKEAKPTPEGKELLQKINDEVGSLYKQVAEAKSSAKDIDEVVSSAQELRELVEASDQLLYEGNPELINNIVEDLKAEGKEESFSKLGVAWIDRMKSDYPEQYYRGVVAPIYQHALQETGMVDAVRGLISAYNKGDNAALRSGIEGIAKHITELGPKVSEYTKAQTEAQATAERTQLQTQIQDDCDLSLNKALGAELRPWLKNTELGTYKRETLVSLAGHMRQTTLAALKGDDTFQKAMGKLWSAQRPDVEQIKKTFNDKVSQIVKETAKKSILQVYPHLKSITSKPAAIPKTVDFKEGTFQLVSNKPAASDLDMTVKHANTMLIAGRGVLKDGKKVCWRRN